MYVLKPGIKNDPVKRWNLPDRIFFGNGACHILAGVFLQQISSNDFHAIWLKPNNDFPGNHIFVTDGDFAFDFHGYSKCERLIAHHGKGWAQRFPGWSASICRVDFSLLDTPSLNFRRMLGPEQYLFNPIPRAIQFLNRFKHHDAYIKNASETPA